MKYPMPTLLTPKDPTLNYWIDTIPEQFRNNTGLMDFLLRVCHRIYDGNGIERDSRTNPFYKIIELLRANKLEYWHLQKIKEYYHFDIIRYLTEDNRAEHYIGYQCFNAKQLKSALGARKNITDKDTLVQILSKIV